MRKIFTTLLMASLPLFLMYWSADRNHHSNRVSASENESMEENEEKEDGIRETMEMDFMMTRDLKLGYIPRQRMISAQEQLIKDRRLATARISALAWAERGPNSDVVGPSNGNIRGPLNNAVTSGRMRAIWVDLNDPTNKTVWVASVSGGLWKTNNIAAKPATWQLINDFFGNLAISSICQSPLNKNILYFGTGEKSFNADAVRGGGVWKSTDGGATWNLLPNTTGFWNVSKILCDASGNVYVATVGSGSGLQRSTDGGANWTNITPSTIEGGTRITEMEISSTGRLHVIKGYYNSTTGQSGYFYTDAPSTVTTGSWQTATTTIPDLRYNCELAVAGNVLYALPSNSSFQTPQVYKSVDGGNNWTATATSPVVSGASTDILSSGQGWFCIGLGVDPVNPDNVIAGGLNAYRSSDGGASWTKIAQWVGNTGPYIHADHHNITWVGSQVLFSSDGGIDYSSDNGFTFSDRNTGLRAKQFYSCAIHPTLANYFLAGAQDNGTHQLSNSGLAGSVEVFGGDGGFTHIDEDEPSYQFGATTYSNFRRSTNGGTSWTSIAFPGNQGLFINPSDYDDVNNKMYASVNAGNYLLWTDPQSGATFTTVSINAYTTGSVSAIKVSPYTSNRVFFGSNNGAILKADNAHTAIPFITNITPSGIVSGVYISSVNVGTNDNNLIATVSNYGQPHVWVSQNGGSVWTDVSGNLPDIPVRWAMFYPENNSKAIIATELGVFETDNINGASTQWVQNTTFPFVRTNMLQFRPSDRTLVAATHGRGLWTTTIPASSPYVRFASTSTYSQGNKESAGSTDGCRNYKDYTVNMMLDAPASGDAVVTLSISSGTAVEGADFDFTTNGSFASPSKVITFTAGAAATKSITVRVYDDAIIELAESFTITYAVSGSTNAVAAPQSQFFTFHILDNDTPPSSSGGTVSGTIGDGSTTYVQPFRGTFVKSKSQFIYTASELTAAGINAGSITSIAFTITSKASALPFNSLSISLKNTLSTTLAGTFETGATLCYQNNYSTVSGVNTLDFNAGSFSWDGTSNILVEFCYNNATDAITADDRVSTNITSDQKCLWARDNSLTIDGCSLSNLNTTLYGGVASGTSTVYVRPDLTFTGSSGASNDIETVALKNRTEYVAGSGLYYFYTTSSPNIIGNLSSPTANMGCFNMMVSEAGNLWTSFFAGQRSQKVFKTTATGDAGAGHTIGFYFTAAELGGKTPATLSIAKTSAATAALANAGNTGIYQTSVSSYGTGYLFTANVAGVGTYFLTTGLPTGLTVVNSRSEQFVQLLQNPVSHSIRLNIQNESRKTVNAVLYTMNGQILKTWNLGRASGNQELIFSGKVFSAGSYMLRVDNGEKMQTFKLIKQ